MLEAAFRPEPAICEIRAVLHHRSRLIEDAGRFVQRMQKALTEMNLKLDRVIPDVTGVTGMGIIRAIVAGERDLPSVVRCKVPCDSIAQRVWRLSVARDALKQLYQHLGA